MNENIDLTKILKDCPKGTKLYSPVFGEVIFNEISLDQDNPIEVSLSDNVTEDFTKDGKLYNEYYNYKNTECVLFPSKEQRDWSKFKVNKPKFDPNTLHPFDKVIVRNFDYQIWHADIFSHVETDEDGSYYNTIKDDNYLMVIPYNDDTIYLVGTSEEAPEYYRYWED